MIRHGKLFVAGYFALSLFGYDEYWSRKLRVVKVLSPLHNSVFPFPAAEYKVAYYTSEDIRRNRPEAQTKSQKIG